MKKNIGIVFILLFAVGCRNTNLSCTKMVMDLEEVKVEEKISLNFKRKKLTTSFLTLDYYYKDNIEENAKVAKESLEEQFSSYKDSKGVEYFFNNIDNGIHFELQANVEKLTEEEKELLENQINYKSYNDAKEKLIADGYQCK